MYRTNICGFYKFLGEDLTSDTLTLFLLLESHQGFELVSQYHGSLIARNQAPATINQKLAAIKSLVNYALEVEKCHTLIIFDDNRASLQGEVTNMLDDLT